VCFLAVMADVILPVMGYLGGVAFGFQFLSKSRHDALLTFWVECMCVSGGELEGAKPQMPQMAPNMNNPTKVTLFRGQKVKGQRHEAQKTVPVWVSHSCECWLLVVDS